MKPTTITPTIYFDKRGCREGELSVKFLVYFDGSQRMAATGIIIQETDAKFLKNYLKACAKSLIKGKQLPLIENPDQKLLWEMLYTDCYLEPDTQEKKVGYLKRAVNVIQFLQSSFSFDDFKKFVTGYYDIFEPLLSICYPKDETQPVEDKQSEYPNDVPEALIKRQELLYAAEQFGTGDSCRDSASSLLRFFPKFINEHPQLFQNIPYPVLTFETLTVDFLSKFEKWMYKYGKKPKSKDGKPTPASPSTVGIYTRNIRSVYNLAKKHYPDLEKLYPFGKDKYIIPSSRNIKKARTLDEIESIISFECKTEADQLGRDMWLFSYFGNGANMADILRLRNKNLGSGEFNFIRKKTINTKKKDLTPVQVYIEGLAMKIIERWGKKSQDENDYVFPFLSIHMTEYQAHKATKAFISKVNDAMARISKQLGIQGSMTTYAARHSFSTIMLQSGANFVMISKMLSHSSTTTTQLYFDDFKDDQVKLAIKALIPKTSPPIE